ncbi:hypothetical protein HPULCUR_005000 [Helicostylum pulchrum]|uniref:Kinesin-like protein n=1 Tax=Helicostylum pulchrum TaxID=562976 RepID=A0ABP9XXV3_9FUNG
MNSPFSASTPTRAPPRSFLSPKPRSPNPLPKHTKKPIKKLTDADRYTHYNPEKEPIKAYLRIRPKPENYQSIEEPYIEIIDDTQVSMTPPQNSNAYRTRHRAPERYRFTKVFQDRTNQTTFFNETIFDLVQDVLLGNNALLFAYGVTNSGKTFSVMGKVDNAGLLPRSLGLIFNSINEYQSKTKIKPAMHSLAQVYECEDEENRHVLNSCSNEEILQPLDETPTIDIDPNFEYGIWVSFIEVYNEQVYDLLDTMTKPGNKRKQLQLKYEQKSGNKYVADTNTVKVKTIQEALAIMKLGQQNRQVFSTLMNQTSSRSHSIFTIHVVKCPIDENNFVIEDPNYAIVSKLSIVDLAGSERYKNTNSSGQRLKEAGNINKSLMVLGQCMEVLRVNQIKAEMGKNAAIVPFRHSKLTELFKSTFEGDGKAVIIVNVNPFDTGFDENSHVMKFAAVAKDVTTWKQFKPKLDLQNVQVNSKRPRNETKELLPESPDEEEYVEDVEEGEEEEEELNDDNDYFVDSLITQLNDLRNKWIDAETRATNAEIDVRAQVSKENDNELRKMEEMYLLALKRESDMMESQISNRLQLIADNKDINVTDERENAFLTMLHQRQQTVAEEMNVLRMHIKDFDTTRQSMLAKIADLEKENYKERQHSQSLVIELQLQTNNHESSPMLKSIEHATEDEDDEDHDMLKENEDPKSLESFNQFLSLRKQLRRSIFKREELCKDADDIMNQVEQFCGVTFKLAKETKMGKLLKLIAQEEFEKDPYQIRNRAVKLFKRYAQLPTSIEKNGTESSMMMDSVPHELPRQAFASMTINTEESQDFHNLRAENAKLKQKIKLLNKGQNRLKEAFENTKNHQDVLMMDESCTNKASNTVPEVFHQQQDMSLVPEAMSDEPTCTEITKPGVAIEQHVIDDYESDINELLKQKMRHKRRRKLRSR